MNTYSISELAKEFDITARAIRFYEEEGLIVPKRVGRSRIYSQGDYTRLKLTLRGKRLGLSLAEIKQLISLYESQTNNAPQLQAFLRVLQQHSADLAQQRADLEITLSEIQQHIQRCRKLLRAQG